MRCGGIVLCGGQSRRMGRPKPLLPFGKETMLARVVRLVRQAVEPVVVVAAAQMQLPELSADILVAYDRRPERGPLEGLAAGLATLQPHAEAAFVTGCDVPFLRPELVRRLIELAGQHDAVVPWVGDRPEPLTAIYRTHLRGRVEGLLAAGQLRPAALFELVSIRRVLPEELADVDPRLDSLFNVNTPEEYRAALERAGLPVEELEP